jgi:hypothetical protein
MSVSDAQGLAAFEDSTTGPSALLPRNQKDLSKICQGQVHFSRAKRALIEEVLAYSPSIAVDVKGLKANRSMNTQNLKDVCH